MTDKTCDKCKHYTPPAYLDDEWHCNSGDCDLMQPTLKESPCNEFDKCAPDGGPYAGICVGPKFGCIHWTAKP